MGWNYRRIPVIGKEIAKIGHIYDMAVLPCKPTPEIWVLAFFYAVPNLLWSLYKPDPLDDVWSRVGRRRGIKRRQRMTFIEEYTEEIPLKPSLRWVRFAGDWAQRVGWWMLIVDAAIDHAMYWQSGAMAFEGCKSTGIPFAEGEQHGVTSETTGGEWKRLFVATEYWHIFGPGIGEVNIPPGYGYHASMSIASEPDENLSPNDPTTVLAWRIIDGDGAVVAEGETIEAVEGKSRVGNGFAKKPIIRLGGNQIQFQIKTGPVGWAKITSASFSVTGWGIPYGLKQGDP